MVLAHMIACAPLRLNILWTGRPVRFDPDDPACALSVEAATGAGGSHPPNRP